MEATLNTSTLATTCAAISGVSATAGSNYCGAAVSPAGYKLVWWTVGNTSGTGTFKYTYNYGGGWNGPVSFNVTTTDGLGWNMLGYVHLAWRDNTKFVMAGEGFFTSTPNVFTGIVAEGDIGVWPQYLPMYRLAISGATNVVANDVWVNPANNSTHVLAWSVSGTTIGYYFKASGTAWSNSNSTTSTLSNGYRSRFTYDAANATLYLVKGGSSSSSVEVYSQGSMTTNNSAISWASPSNPTKPSYGFGIPAGIYVQRQEHQSMSTTGFHAALCGNAAESPEGIWDGSIFDLSTSY